MIEVWDHYFENVRQMEHDYVSIDKLIDYLYYDGLTGFNFIKIDNNRFIAFGNDYINNRTYTYITENGIYTGVDEILIHKFNDEELSYISDLMNFTDTKGKIRLLDGLLFLQLSYTINDKPPKSAMSRPAHTRL